MSPRPIMDPSAICVFTLLGIWCLYLLLDIDGEEARPAVRP